MALCLPFPAETHASVVYCPYITGFSPHATLTPKTLTMLQTSFCFGHVPPFICRMACILANLVHKCLHSIYVALLLLSCIHLNQNDCCLLHLTLTLLFTFLTNILPVHCYIVQLPVAPVTLAAPPGGQQDPLHQSHILFPLESLLESTFNIKSVLFQPPI